MRPRSLVPLIYILFLLLPIYWLVAMSFKTTNEILGGFSLFPQEWTLANYAAIFTDPTWYWGYINSIIYVSLNTIISLLAALPAAQAQNQVFQKAGPGGAAAGGASPLGETSIGAGAAFSFAATRRRHLPSALCWQNLLRDRDHRRYL